MNLEKVLVKQNRKLAIPEELLRIAEYEKYATLADNDALERLGLNSNLKQGKQDLTSIDISRKQTTEFNQERVFHVSQIKAICDKYHLRFLPSRYFSGTIDVELPNKISQFEIAYGKTCNQQNSFIMAPAKSFNLEPKPKDPLLFYKINDTYFYLIHKWGNDLSASRIILKYLSNAFVTWFIWALILGSPLLLFAQVSKGGTVIIYFINFLVATILCLMQYEKKPRRWAGTSDDTIRLVKENDWNSATL